MYNKLAWNVERRTIYTIQDDNICVILIVEKEMNGTKQIGKYYNNVYLCIENIIFTSLNKRKK